MDLGASARRMQVEPSRFQLGSFEVDLTELVLHVPCVAILEGRPVRDSHRTSSAGPPWVAPRFGRAPPAPSPPASLFAVVTVSSEGDRGVAVSRATTTSSCRARHAVMWPTANLLQRCAQRRRSASSAVKTVTQITFPRWWVLPATRCDGASRGESLPVRCGRDGDMARTHLSGWTMHPHLPALEEWPRSFTYDIRGESAEIALLGTKRRLAGRRDSNRISEGRRQCQHSEARSRRQGLRSRRSVPLIPPRAASLCSSDGHRLFA